MPNRFYPIVALIVTSMTSIAFGAAESGETPNIFAGGLGTSVWTFLVFVGLIFILGKFAWKPLLESLQKREDHIRQSIEEAEKARGEAEQAQADFQQQLADARQEAQTIIEKSRSDATKLADDIRNKAQDEAQKLRDRAQQDIAAAKNQALNEIYEQVTVLATDVAGKIIQKSLDPNDHRQLLDETLNKIQSTDINP